MNDSHTHRWVCGPIVDGKTTMTCACGAPAREVEACPSLRGLTTLGAGPAKTLGVTARYMPFNGYRIG